MHSWQVCVAGFVTGLFHTFMGIPAILAGILTQLGLYSVNLRIMGEKAQPGHLTVRTSMTCWFPCVLSKCVPCLKIPSIVVAMCVSWS